MRTFIEVNLTHAGQPRPYADHLYKGTIKIEYESKREWSPEYHYGIPPEIKPPDLDPTKTFVHIERIPAILSEDIIKRKYAKLICDFEENGDWASPKLRSITEIGPGLWEVVITAAYTD